MTSIRRVGLTKCPRTHSAAERIAAHICGDIRWFEEGRGLANAIAAGELDAVVEVSFSDLKAACVRLTTACQAAIPLVIVPGGLEYCSPEDGDRIGREIAFLASASRGPVTVIVPACTPPTLAQSLRNWISSDVRVIGSAARIDEDVCAATVAAALGSMRAKR